VLDEPWLPREKERAFLRYRGRDLLVLKRIIMRVRRAMIRRGEDGDDYEAEERRNRSSDMRIPPTGAWELRFSG
jgi:hypothetical protein